MHGQEVNIDFWVVKNLDPGRERMYRVNGSDLPLLKGLACETKWNSRVYVRGKKTYLV